MLERQGLWPDEVFSLAIATGHSLEHPSATAQPASGDFVEPAGPLPAAEYRSYLAHDERPAGVARVWRATRLSDTSPPLYYLLLHAWTRAVGTGDASLRAFSTLSWAASLPLLWLVAGRLGGRPAAWLACVLFSFGPASVYYATEGRMYSLLWFWALAAAWLTLRLAERRLQPARLLAWALVSAAGLLTHYFFVFVWAGMVLWLLLRSGEGARRAAVLGALLTALLLFPWYAHVPEDLGRWRVTKDWLRWQPSGYDPRWAAFALARGFVSGGGVWGGGPRADQAAVVVCALAVGALAWNLGGRAVRGRRLLPWLWLAGACLGPVLFDRLLGTYSGSVPRYALAGMPAVFVLMGLGFARLHPGARAAALALVLACWLPGLRTLFANRSRAFSPLRQVARLLDRRAAPNDVIVVHSIPSGVLGIARYMRGSAPLAAWVGQLGQRRVPESIAALTSGRRRTFLVLVHTVGEPAPEEVYLRQHADLLRDEWRETARILEFAPRIGAPRSPLPE